MSIKRNVALFAAGVTGLMSGCGENPGNVDEQAIDAMSSRTPVSVDIRGVSYDDPSIDPNAKRFREWNLSEVCGNEEFVGAEVKVAEAEQSSDKQVYTASAKVTCGTDLDGDGKISKDDGEMHTVQGPEVEVTYNDTNGDGEPDIVKAE